MKLNQQKEALVMSTDDSQESVKMTLDQDSAQILMQMLSKNLYSDPIGSAVRETASNALDSHRRAGTTKPIIVRFGRNADDNYEFSVEDFGTGLDADDVENIISKYGKSTKRSDDTQLGAFGLGFKSPLAYASAFYFICRKDGVERRYMMYEGEETNSIDQLHEAPTKEPNGVKVIVPVQYKDRFAFQDKIAEQLSYFEDVYFDVQGISNDFSIIRSEHFQMSDINQDGSMHICLDNVYYPIDWNKLGIKSIGVPVGLRFSLTDGIMPIPNREAIKYTEEAKTLILNKIKDVADTFVTKYNKDADNGNLTFLEIRNCYRANQVTCKIEDKTLHFTELVPISRIPLVKPEIGNLFYFTTKQVMGFGGNLFAEYRKAYQLYNKRFSESKVGNYYSDFDLDRLAAEKSYLYTGTFRGITKDYLRSTLPQFNNYTFYRKAFPYPLMPKVDSQGKRVQNFYDLLELKKYPKNEWRAVIKEFQMVQNMVLDTIPKVEDVVVPQSFIDARKQANVQTGKIAKVRAIGEVPCKKAVDLEREVTGKNCKFVPENVNISKISSSPFVYVYTEHEKSIQLDKYFKTFQRQKLVLLTFSPREIAKLKDLKIHNLIPLEEWEKGEHRMFRRVTTAFAIYDQWFRGYTSVFNYKDKLKTLKFDLWNKIYTLQEYYKLNGSDHPFRYMNREENMFVPYMKKGLFDPLISDKFYYIMGWVNHFDFVNPVLGHLYHSPFCEKVLRDMFKYHGFRLDYHNYRLPEEITND